MDPVPITKGRLTNIRTGVFVAFLYNPASIKKSRGINLHSDPLPMTSDPLIRWMSGGDTNVSFTIELCGESSLRFRGANIVNSRESDVEEDPGSTLGVDGELEWLESFTYPVDPSLPGSKGGADLLVFSYGRAFRHYTCAMAGFEVTYKQFTPDGRTMRASVGLQLRKVETRTVFSDEIYSAGYEGFIP